VERAYPPPWTPQPAAITEPKTNPSNTSVSGCIVRHMSLLHPPQGFPPHLAVIWPLIWVQLLLLRAAVRAAYGKGVQYHWSVSPNGLVFLTSIDWMPGQKKERVLPKPANDRLAAACDGRLFTPDYLRLQPLSLGLARRSRRIASARARVGVRGKGVSASAVSAAAMAPLIPTPLLGRMQCIRSSSQAPRRRGLNLPLPET
jgi:hypothetical protein